MFYHFSLPGLQYEGETPEQAERREKHMAEENRKIEKLHADWERQRRTPMASMIQWAEKNGILKDR